MQDVEQYNISHIEADINFHYERVKSAKAYLEALPEDLSEYRRVVHKTYKIMANHFDSLIKAKEFIVNTRELKQIVLNEIKKLRETEKPHNIFYCIYNQDLCNENELCFIFWLLSVFEYFILQIEKAASVKKCLREEKIIEKTIQPKLNVDFLMPDLILLIILRACKKPNKKKLNEIIDVWYGRECNAIKNKALMVLNRTDISSGSKIPTVSEVATETFSKHYSQKLETQRDNLINFAFEYPNLLQDIGLLNQFINSYTDNFRNDKLRFEHFNYAKHLFVFNEFLKIKEREGVSIGYLILTPYSFNEVIENVFNPTCLIKKSEEIEKEMHKYQFIVFLLILVRLGAIQFIDLDINCPIDNDSTNDYWTFKISIDPKFRIICGIDINKNTLNAGNKESESVSKLPIVLYYDDNNKKVSMEGKLYELDNQPVLYKTLKIFITTPNVKLSMDLFKSNEDTDNSVTIRQRIGRLKKAIPELGKYMPEASKHDPGYILCLEKTQIEKF